MSGKKVKIVGYAKKEFFSNGIEYRNFSPDLVGNQMASNEGTPIFTAGNFNITTNLDGKVDKNFVTNNFSNFKSLETLNLDETLEKNIEKYSKKIKLNLDYNDILSFAFFGSFKEYIRITLENIIIKWPASLYIDISKDDTPTLTGNTVDNPNYNPIDDETTFDVSTERINNDYGINFLSGGTIENTFNETNPLRNLNISYNNYCISIGEGEDEINYQINGFTGATDLNGSNIKFCVSGNPFSGNTSVIPYHIKPIETKIEEFFFNLNDFENNLLNRLTTPKYTGKFKVYHETENGVSIELDKTLTWPTSDGYNLDFNSIAYANYVETLIEIADINDSLRSDLMVRFLVSSSISDFDTIRDINGTFYGSNGQKMTRALRIYGREFDEIKNYSDGISYANVVTYDKKNNTPDAVLKNLARVLGWELTTSISQVDILSNFLSLSGNEYEGYSRGISDSESEIELWRRIVLNTPWIWKSKGTRKVIEFLFKFIGAPDELVTFNEYLYVADKKVDADLAVEMMEYFNYTSDIDGLNLDKDGFPKVLPNNPEMYFQKAGLWYRQTGGITPDIDILDGNNPHIGPYDGGQAYINQFTKCLIPNFSGSTGENLDIDDRVNLFTNYGMGTFDECCNSDVIVDINTNHDFNAILQTNINKILNNNPYTLTGCTFTHNWKMIASLSGETFYETTINSSANSPTEIEYIDAIQTLSGTTDLSGVTFNYDGNEHIMRMVVSKGDCDNNFIDKFFKIEVCVETTYDCIDEGNNVTMFLVSNRETDPCNDTFTYPLGVELYHNGSDLKPDFGDRVYYDSLGSNPFITPLGSPKLDLFMGPDTSSLENYLRTDENGYRVEIECT